MMPSLEFGPVSIYVGQKNGKYPDGNQVIVQGADRRAVFDSPLVSNCIGEAFDGADLVIQGHVHEDHITGLHRLPETPVYIHDADLPAMRSWQGLFAAYGIAQELNEEFRRAIEAAFNYQPRPDAIGYSDGAVWDLGGGVTVRAIHTPGHTAGHCALLVEPQELLFIGDIDLTGFGPYYGDSTSDLKQFRKTLAMLPDLPASTWVTYHHRGTYTQRSDFLRDLAIYVDKIDERGERLLHMLREQPATLEALALRGLLYSQEGAPLGTVDIERRTIVQHLEELREMNLISQDDQQRWHVCL